MRPRGTSYRGPALVVLLFFVGLVFGTGPAFSAPGWKARRAARDLVALGLVEMGRDAVPEAESAFARAVALDSTSVDARFLLALSRLELERPLDALADLEVATKGIEAPPRAMLYARARCFRGLDRLEEAVALERTAREVPIETVADHLRMSWYLFRRGIERLEGARGEAIAAISAHERKNPPFGRLTLSCVYRRLGDEKSALEQAHFASKQPSAGAWTWVHWADLLRIAGNRKREIEILERAVVLDPGNLAARVRLIVLTIARGDGTEAQDRLDLLCARPDAPANAFWLRAWVRLRFGAREKAVADLGRALAGTPDAGVPGGIDPFDRRLRPEAYARIEKAAARIEAPSPDDLVPDLYLRMRGHALLEVGRNVEALADFTRAIEVAPEQADLLRDAILRARLGVEPAAVAKEIETLIPGAVGDERLALAWTVVRAHLVRSDWPRVFESACRLRGLLASRRADRIAQGLEPGSSIRRDLECRAALCRILEARARLAKGDRPGAKKDLAAVGARFQPEVAAMMAYLDPEKRVAHLARFSAIFEPTILMDRGRDHPLNGWAARFAAEACLLAGDDDGSRTWFAAAVRGALPAWSDDIIAPGE